MHKSAADEDRPGQLSIRKLLRHVCDQNIFPRKTFFSLRKPIFKIKLKPQIDFYQLENLSMGEHCGVN